MKRHLLLAVCLALCASQALAESGCNIAPLDDMRKEVQDALRQGKIVKDSHQPRQGIDFKALKKYLPAEGVVASEGVAVSLGSLLLENKYGTELVKQASPFEAKLTPNGIWVVKRKMKDPCTVLTFDLLVVIRKKDGAVLGFDMQK